MSSDRAAWRSSAIARIDVASALLAAADAPAIACLVGTQGGVLAWGPPPGPEQTLRELARAASALPASAIDERGWGETWGMPPPGSIFVQLDYEYPLHTPFLLRPEAVLRWDAAGAATLDAADDEILEAVLRRLGEAPEAPEPPRLAAALTPAWGLDGHRARIERIKEWIAAGDCYQANLAVRFGGLLEAGPDRDLALFAALLRASPAPYAGFFRRPGRPSVVSHSPECLLAVRGDRAVSVPIKGTRRLVPGRETATRAELLAAPKDAAELAMIVDLVRNDLGRIAMPGSVRVVDERLMLDLGYVHHRAARIEARLRASSPDTLPQAIAALFPAGSITGAPKLRVMEIIAELEGSPRGAYCGAFGWIGPGGADLAVAIRTACVDGERVLLHAGGGIVWDSDPIAEWDEVQAKAAGFTRALIEAEERA